MHFGHTFNAHELPWTTLQSISFCIQLHTNIYIYIAMIIGRDDIIKFNALFFQARRIWIHYLQTKHAHITLVFNFCIQYNNISSLCLFSTRSSRRNLQYSQFLLTRSQLYGGQSKWVKLNAKGCSSADPERTFFLFSRWGCPIWIPWPRSFSARRMQFQTKSSVPPETTRSLNLELFPIFNKINILLA